MRLVTACMLVSSTTFLANGFQATSPLSVRTSHVSSSSAIVAAATMSATSSSMSYDEVNKLAFRALQSQCKELGLSAVGTTAALRGRLLEHFGLLKEVALQKEAPAATAAEIEVRRNVSTILLYERIAPCAALISHASIFIAGLGTLRHRWHLILRWIWSRLWLQNTPWRSHAKVIRRTLEISNTQTQKAQ